MKVAKEELMALLTALQLFCEGDYDSHLEEFSGWLEQISAQLGSCPVTCRLLESEDGQAPSRLEIQLGVSGLQRNAMEICRALREGDPPVYVGHEHLHENILVVNPFCMVKDQVEPLGRRLAEEIGS